MSIQLSDHFDIKKLLRFTLPSIITMLFTSIYGIVDGLFVSNFVGKTPFAAVNFVIPVMMIVAAVGFMFGTGGSALISKTLGEGDKEKANRLFSLFVYLSFGLGIVIAAVAFVFLRPIVSMIGAKDEMLSYCVTYGRIILLSLPAYILQMEFQSFFVTAEKPKLGLYVTILCGVTNMILDALFMAVFHWGVAGAAAATAISQTLGGIIPLFYFFKENTSLLRLGKTKFDGKATLKACTNGSSEFLSNISGSLVGMLYNIQLMKYAGENGVAAYGVLMYVSMIFCAIFIGYAVGTAPVIGYHYGAGHQDELKSLLKKSSLILVITSVVMFISSELLGRPLAGLFVGYDAELLHLTEKGFMIFSIAFLFIGFNIFSSSFFTALNNGLVSALISFLRTLVFQIAAVLLLPLIWEIDGIWLSIIVAELLSLVVSILFLFGMRKKYQYL
ncbi:MAG: MATE family efflux transporter [Clostridiales bacterium]|nr:MATE family efflux transporter [Clostridiales bacterium]